MGDIGLILSQTFATISDPMTMLMVFVGTFMGLTFRALPGLTATMGVALLVPITYSMDPAIAIGMMLGCYVGGISGGSIASILINIPGTSSALVTTFDGYPMAQNGRGAEALGWAAISSGVGGLVSWVALVLFSPLLAACCTSFSSPEYAALTFFGLTIVASINNKNMLKGLMAAAIGVMLGCVGMDPLYSVTRFTFGSVKLMGGLQMMPLVIGLYAIPQVLESCDRRTEKAPELDLRCKSYIPSLARMWKTKFTWLVSSVIGTVIGIIPATGQSIACFYGLRPGHKLVETPGEIRKRDPPRRGGGRVRQQRRLRRCHGPPADPGDTGGRHYRHHAGGIHHPGPPAGAKVF